MKKHTPIAVGLTLNKKCERLTIGLDLGDRSSYYCVLDAAGDVLLEQKVSTTPKAMRDVFGSMPKCRIALETGTHSPWVSRLLNALGHEVIVGHAQKVRLITKSRRKDDPLLRSSPLEDQLRSRSGPRCRNGLLFPRLPTE